MFICSSGHLPTACYSDADDAYHYSNYDNVSYFDTSTQAELEIAGTSHHQSERIN